METWLPLFDNGDKIYMYGFQLGSLIHASNCLFYVYKWHEWKYASGIWGGREVAFHILGGHLGPLVGLLLKDK